MAQAIMNASKRERAGKGAARAVRRQGQTPGVIYGAGKAPLTINVDPRDIMKGLHTGHFYNTVYQVKLNDGSVEHTLPRDVQFHPVSDAPIHIDFMRISAGTTIHVMVPVVFRNEQSCPGIRMGGLLQVVREEVELICQADAIPEELHVDLSKAEMGDTLRFSHADCPANVRSAITDRDFVLAVIAAPRTKEEDAPATATT